MTSKAPFRFPLTAGDLAHFCHPCPRSVLARPHLLDGWLTAGNHHIAIRAFTGRWASSDFLPAPREFVTRLSTLPWHALPLSQGPWLELANLRRLIYASPPIPLWTQKHRHAPSPVWQIAGHLVRLSHLQLLARLPCARIYLGPATPDAPLFFRYNNGCGIMPPNPKLHTPTHHLLPEISPSPPYSQTCSQNSSSSH